MNTNLFVMFDNEQETKNIILQVFKWCYGIADEEIDIIDESNKYSTYEITFQLHCANAINRMFKNWDSTRNVIKEILTMKFSRNVSVTQRISDAPRERFKEIDSLTGSRGIHATVEQLQVYIRCDVLS